MDLWPVLLFRNVLIDQSDPPDKTREGAAMLIIVEGGDAADTDVTSVADHIAAELRRMHPGDTVDLLIPDPTETDPLARFLQPLIRYRPKPRLQRAPDGRGWLEVPARHIVCEGWHWSAWVRSMLSGGPSVPSPGVMWYLNLFLRSRGAFVVRLMNDQDPTVHGHDGHQQNRMFDVLIPNTTLPWVAHYVGETPCVSDLIACAQGTANACFIVRNLTTYIGPPNPHALLLGNTRPPDGSLHLPAFMPYPGSPGEFLADAMSQPGSPFTDIGVVNACDHDELAAAMDLLSPRVVIPLGGQPFRAYRDLRPEYTRDLEMFTMPHPTHARAFQGYGTYEDKIAAYANVLGQDFYKPLPRQHRV